jgi:hypothetical protein
VPTVRFWSMADSRLSAHDRELFLAGPHIAALSVSAGPGRGPLSLPIWYQYEPGGEAWVLTEAGSRKARLIQAAGRFTLMVERAAPTTRYMSVEGPVTRCLGNQRAAAGDRRAVSAAGQGHGHAPLRLPRRRRSRGSGHRVNGRRSRSHATAL